MFSDKVFKNCLLMSLALHIIIVFNITPIRIFSHARLKPDRAKEIEVTYYKKATPVKASRLLPQALVSARDKIEKTPLPYKQSKPAPVIQKTGFKKNIKPAEKIHKPVTPTTEKIRVLKETITQDKWRIFHESTDLSSQPSYLKYYNIVRAKIEKTANTNKPYLFKIGEINLIFTILNNGDLRNVDLVNSGSAVLDPALTQCALDSVYAASPFPPFTGDIREDHLTFQVSISFEK